MAQKERYNRIFRKRFLIYVLLIAVVLLIAGSVYLWAQQKSRSGIIMSHKLKAEDIRVDCSMCHAIKEENTRFMTFPDHETCNLCHSEQIVEGLDTTNCKLCHDLPKNESRVRKNQVLAPHVVFDHKKHEEKEIDCLLCHPIPDSSVLIGNEMLPKMEVCTACHTERRVMDVQDCSRCHIKDFEKIRPLDHTDTWINTHGEGLSRDRIDTNCRTCHSPQLKNSCTTCHHEKKMRIGKTDYCASCHGEGYEKYRPANHTSFWFSTHGKGLLKNKIDSNCTLCHTKKNENDCLSCHKKEKPRDHNVAWNIRTHGAKAQINRESCSTCHNQSECIECHTTNPPFSHTGLWGSPYQRHCRHCHVQGNNFAVSDTGSNCTFCHRGSVIPGIHRSLQKPGHFVGSNCLNCHQPPGFFGAPGVSHAFPSSAQACASCHQ
jgi:hypothetical protein